MPKRKDVDVGGKEETVKRPKKQLTYALILARKPGAVRSRPPPLASPRSFVADNFCLIDSDAGTKDDDDRTSTAESDALISFSADRPRPTSMDCTFRIPVYIGDGQHSPLTVNKFSPASPQRACQSNEYSPASPPYTPLSPDYTPISPKFTRISEEYTHLSPEHYSSYSYIPLSPEHYSPDSYTPL